MEKITEQMFLLQIRNLEEQIRILRQEKIVCEERIRNLEETINKILENGDMLG